MILCTINMFTLLPKTNVYFFLFFFDKFSCLFYRTFLIVLTKLIILYQKISYGCGDMMRKGKYIRESVRQGKDM